MASEIWGSNKEVYEGTKDYSEKLNDDLNIRVKKDDDISLGLENWLNELEREENNKKELSSKLIQKTQELFESTD